jgi:hypothetical protein
LRSGVADANRDRNSSDADPDTYSYSDSDWNTDALADVRASTERRIRRHHDVDRGWLGADQSQHDDRDNGMVPGK